MMNSPTDELDYAKPYNLMIGVWTGIANMFDPRGNFLGAFPSIIKMNWKDENTMSFDQVSGDGLHESDFLNQNPNAKQAVSHLTEISFDLTINGKYSEGGNETTKVTGAESMSGIYLFQLRFPDRIYNNSQYFVGENQRNIIGPITDNKGYVQWVLAQTFTRVSYDVPK